MVVLSVEDAPPPLEVTRDGVLGAMLRIDGRPLGYLPPDGRRSLSEARRLMPACGDLQALQDLRSELGERAWADVHLALCAEMQPLIVPAGELIFSGEQPLRQPLLIIDGHATLLAQPPPSPATSTSAPRLGDDEDQPEEVTVLRPGNCLTTASCSWLQPLAVAAIANTDVQLLALPGPVFAARCQLAHLRLLNRRERALAALPLLRQCPASGLRALAFAADEGGHGRGEALCDEGAPCEGLQVLTAGSAKVCVQLSVPGLARPTPTPAAAAALASSSGRRQPSASSAAPSPAAAPSPVAAETAQMAEVSAPELLGIIDVMTSLLQRGREVQQRTAATAATTTSSSAADAADAATATVAAAAAAAGPSFGAVHGASVIATAPCRVMRLRTSDVLRHAGPLCLGELSRAAYDRSIVRSSLRVELLRQAQRQRMLSMGAQYRTVTAAATTGAMGPRAGGLGGGGLSTSDASAAAAQPGGKKQRRQPRRQGGGAGTTPSRPPTSGGGGGPASNPAAPPRPQLPVLPQPAPPAPPRPGALSAGPVPLSDGGGGGGGAAMPQSSSAATGRALGLGSRPSTSSLLGGSFSSSFSSPALLAHTSRSLPALLPPPSLPGTPGGRLSTPFRIMANPSLLPPTVGTPAQLAHAKTAVRAHNLTTARRLLERSGREAGGSHGGSRGGSRGGGRSGSRSSGRSGVGSGWAGQAVPWWAREDATADGNDDDGDDDEEDEEEGARPPSVLSSPAFWAVQDLRGRSGGAASGSLSRAKSGAEGGAGPHAAGVPAIWAATPVALTRPSKGGRIAAPAVVRHSLAGDSAVVGGEFEALLRSDISSTLGGLLDPGGIKFTRFDSDEHVHTGA